MPTYGNAININDELTAKFWTRVEIRGEKQCWHWKGKVHRSGYGLLRHKGRDYWAHRLSLALSGVNVTGVLALHRCDTPSCVNPMHIYAGTHKDNVGDLIERGRHGRAKLTEEDVIEIRRRRADGETYSQLAREYGVSPSALNAAANGLTWQHVA